MRHGFLASVAGLLTGATLSLAQAPSPAPSPYLPDASHSALAGPAQSPYGPRGSGVAPFSAPLSPVPAGAPLPEVSPAPLPTPPAESPYNPHCAAIQPVPASGIWQGFKDHAAVPELYVTGGADFLLWWIKDNHLSVPLVTTGSLAGRGTLGQADTSSVFGPGTLNYHQFTGGRINLALWHNAERDRGVEGSVFALGQKSVRFSASGDGSASSPVVSVPFHDVLSDTERVSLVALPGSFAGGVVVRSQSDLWGAEGNFVYKAGLLDGPSSVWLLAGFRYVDLGEDLVVTQGSRILPFGSVTLPSGDILPGGRSGFAGATVLAPNLVSVRDSFRTRNQFYGGQIGFRAEVQRGDAFAIVTGKLGLGGTEETLEIRGSTAVTPGSPSNTLPGGLLATSTNSGRNTHNSFAVLPEGSVKVGYYLTPHIRGTVGYDFLYWSNVIRPTEQIDRFVNRTRVPTSELYGNLSGSSRPLMDFKESDFWAHGMNVGLDFSY